MSRNYPISIAFVVAAGSMLAACDKPSAPTPGAATATPAANPTPAAKPTAAPTPSATAAPAAIVGIKAGEILAGSCSSIDKDSECAEMVVTAESDKAKGLADLKKLCQGTTTESACATDKVVGTCRVFKDVIVHYHSAGPKNYTADTAKKACEKNHGTWVQGP